MRASYIISALSLTLLYAGCSGPKEPVSFYLSDQKPTYGGVAIPTNLPALVITRLQFVGPDTNQGTITIKFFPADAAAIEKLTTDNFGKTVVMVQGTDVLSVARITAPVTSQAGLMFPVNTNLDFWRAYRDLLKLE